jgi:hypothetical protein
LSRPLAPYPALLTLPGSSVPLPLFTVALVALWHVARHRLGRPLRVSRRYTDKTGQKQERTEWYQVVAFGKRAGFMNT